MNVKEQGNEKIEVSDLNKKDKIVELLMENIIPVETNTNYAGTDKEISTYIIKERLLKNNNNKYYIFRTIPDYEELYSFAINLSIIVDKEKRKNSYS